MAASLAIILLLGLPAKRIFEILRLPGFVGNVDIRHSYRTSCS